MPVISARRPHQSTSNREREPNITVQHYSQLNVHVQLCWTDVTCLFCLCQPHTPVNNKTARLPQSAVPVIHCQSAVPVIHSPSPLKACAHLHVGHLFFGGQLPNGFMQFLQLPHVRRAHFLFGGVWWGRG